MFVRMARRGLIRSIHARVSGRLKWLGWGVRRRASTIHRSRPCERGNGLGIEVIHVRRVGNIPHPETESLDVAVLHAEGQRRNGAPCSVGAKHGTRGYGVMAEGWAG